MNLSGKKALVTGASRGIGRSIAEAFVVQGIQVFGTSRNPESVDWPEGITPIALDLSSSQSVQNAWDLAKLGEQGFDILVNNAGAGAFGSFGDLEFAQWEDQIASMLLGPMKLAQLCMKQWSAERPGVLVCVGSLAIEYPIPYMSGYNAAKAGLAAFCESLLLEGDPRVARVLELRLGDVNTQFNEHVFGGARGSRQDRVWRAMCRHVAKGPSAEQVAQQLVRHLERDAVGVVRVGGFFQAFVASVFGRLVSHRIRRAVNLSYYKAGSER